MSVYENTNRSGKWHCDRCNTWCENSTYECLLCSNARPDPKTTRQQPPNPNTKVAKESESPEETHRAAMNSLRCTASEIIIQLFNNQCREQLELLKIMVDNSLLDLRKK